MNKLSFTLILLAIIMGTMAQELTDTNEAEIWDNTVDTDTAGTNGNVEGDETYDDS
jgi:hypothetical protein